VIRPKLLKYQENGDLISVRGLQRVIDYSAMPGFTHDFWVAGHPLDCGQHVRGHAKPNASPLVGCLGHSNLRGWGQAKA
jgi:hypothetical protein